MNFDRIWALIERDMRKFFRSPALMMTSMVFPLVQLIVLGYAFGGKIKGARVAVVDQDHSVESRKVHEMFDGIAAGPQTFKLVDYDSLPSAIRRSANRGCVRGRDRSFRTIFRGAIISTTVPDRIQRRQHRPVHFQRASGGVQGMVER